MKKLQAVNCKNKSCNNVLGYFDAKKGREYYPGCVVEVFEGTCENCGLKQEIVFYITTENP